MNHQSGINPRPRIALGQILGETPVHGEPPPEHRGSSSSTNRTRSSAEDPRTVLDAVPAETIKDGSDRRGNSASFADLASSSSSTDIPTAGAQDPLRMRRHDPTIPSSSLLRFGYIIANVNGA